MSFVTRDGWNVSYSTGYDIDGTKIEGCRLNVFKVVGKPLAVRYGDHNGKLFKNTAEAQEFAYQKGYLQLHHRNDTYGWRGTKRPKIYALHMKHGQEIGAKRKTA
jgi:hypothetical protein